MKKIMAREYLLGMKKRFYFNFIKSDIENFDSKNNSSASAVFHESTVFTRHNN